MQKPFTQFISGKAGCGKTYMVRELISNNPSYGILAATTGIAGVNLNTSTINSLLHYFDTESLKDSFIDGDLNTSIRKIALHYNNIIIDEVSMMDADQLDYIYKSIEIVNNNFQIPNPLGLILVGDFAQLPPVNAKFAFEAECWSEFEANTLKLTKIWRQSNEMFISAINSARSGNGSECYNLLNDLKVEFTQEIDENFKGTTIFSRNEDVDRFNWIRQRKVKGGLIKSKREVWGRELKEWKNIPEVNEIKIGDYVMILNNQSLGYENGKHLGFEYCNGDCGYVRDYNSIDDSIVIELVRNNKIIEVPRITRNNEKREKPKGIEGVDYKLIEKLISGKVKISYSIGSVNYHPLRLAYAATAHKTQGLSLDNVQLNIKNHFFSSPNMLYVALSRARNPEGLRVVGNEKLMKLRCNIDSKVKRFI